jgi:hypothetical protein
VPAYERYLLLDELEASTDRFAAAHPTVEVWRAGASRGGHEIRCLEVGGGPLRAALVGAPHPEEPIGTLVLDFLLPLLVETDLTERLGFSFSVVKVRDPDGMRLNERWFADPGDLVGFLLRQYRPPFVEQFGWTISPSTTSGARSPSRCRRRARSWRSSAVRRSTSTWACTTATSAGPTSTSRTTTPR